MNIKKAAEVSPKLQLNSKNEVVGKTSSPNFNPKTHNKNSSQQRKIEKSTVEY